MPRTTPNVLTVQTPRVRPEGVEIGPHTYSLAECDDVAIRSLCQEHGVSFQGGLKLRDSMVRKLRGVRIETATRDYLLDCCDLLGVRIPPRTRKVDIAAALGRFLQSTEAAARVSSSTEHEASRPVRDVQATTSADTGATPDPGDPVANPAPPASARRRNQPSNAGNDLAMATPPSTPRERTPSHARSTPAGNTRPHTNVNVDVSMSNSAASPTSRPARTSPPAREGDPASGTAPGLQHSQWASPAPDAPVAPEPPDDRPSRVGSNDDQSRIEALEAQTRRMYEVMTQQYETIAALSRQIRQMHARPGDQTLAPPPPTIQGLHGDEEESSQIPPSRRARTLPRREYAAVEDDPEPVGSQNRPVSSTLARQSYHTPLPGETTRRRREPSLPDIGRRPLDPPVNGTDGQLTLQDFASLIARALDRESGDEDPDAGRRLGRLLRG